MTDSGEAVTGSGAGNGRRIQVLMTCLALNAKKIARRFKTHVDVGRGLGPWSRQPLDEQHVPYGLRDRPEEQPSRRATSSIQPMVMLLGRMG